MYCLASCCQQTGPDSVRPFYWKHSRPEKLYRSLVYFCLSNSCSPSRPSRLFNYIGRCSNHTESLALAEATSFCRHATNAYSTTTTLSLSWPSSWLNSNTIFVHYARWSRNVHRFTVSTIEPSEGYTLQWSFVSGSAVQIVVLQATFIPVCSFRRTSKVVPSA